MPMTRMPPRHIFNPEYRLMWRSPSSAFAGMDLLVPVDSVSQYVTDEVGQWAHVLLFGDMEPTFVFMDELVVWRVE